MSNLPVASESSSYFRSRIYTSQIGNNPLLMAAQPILSFLLRYPKTKPKPPSDETEKNLAYELKAFTFYIKTFDYSLDTVVLAQYCIASLLHQQIKTVNWLQYTDWFTTQAMTLPTTKLNKGFLRIINQLKQQPSQNRDLLELCYQSISIGLIQYPKSGELLEELYALIRQPSAAPPPTHQPTRNHLLLSVPFWCTVGIFVCGTVLLSTYLGLNYVVDLTAGQLNQQLEQIQQQLAHMGRTF